MPRYKMVVLSNPVEGREAEYNDWYQHTHLAQVVALTGFKSAQRFRLARSLGQRESWSYLTIYEIESDDIDAVVQELQTHAGSASLMISEAIDTDAAYASIYEEMAPAVLKK